MTMETDVRKNTADALEKQRLDLQLDQELQDTFPASDALKINRRQPDKPSRSRHTKTDKPQ